MIFPPFSYKAIISSSNARMDYMLLWDIGFMEVIAEQNPVIPLYRDSNVQGAGKIALHCISIRLTRILRAEKEG